MKVVVAAFAVAALGAAGAAFAAGDLDVPLGKALFERDWIPAPASTDSTDGLGPLFSARSCAGCHAGPTLAARFTDAPDGRIAGRGFVIRFGDAEGRPDPLYGHLLQGQAVHGMQAEGRVVLLASADPAHAYTYDMALTRGALDPATHVSARLAPPLVGRAALERIDAGAVMALADPDDANKDGISGRARMIAAPTARRSAATAGRRKAPASRIRSPMRSPWRSASQARDVRSPTAIARRVRPIAWGRPPARATAIRATSFRRRSSGLSPLTCAAWTRRALRHDAHGAALFASTGCAACHVPEMPASDGGVVMAHTDLLLHDMGAALDDGVGEPGVRSAEWRTSPLIGMKPGGGRRYLHDGRAATPEAAIRAHGGEAAAALQRYEALDDNARRALLAYVESL